MFYNPHHRDFIASMISYYLPKKTNNKIKINSEIWDKIQFLIEDGEVVLENFITQKQIEEMRAYLDTKLCFDPDRPEREGFSSPDFAHKSCLHAYYAPEDIVGTPHLFDIVNDPRILNIIENIFQAKPTVSYMAIWWLLHGFELQSNYDKRDIKNPAEFHRDMDDWLGLKLFIYLTDVDESSGYHAFIKKSHTELLPLREKRFLDIKNNTTEFPITDNLIKFIGNAGFAWLENSYVFHRGMIPINKHRLILAVTYSLFPLPFGPENPLSSCPDKQKFDSYINRIYLHNTDNL